MLYFADAVRLGPGRSRLPALWGCKIMIQADEASILIASNRLVLYWIALWSILPNRQSHVVLVHGALLANEFPLRLCGRELWTALGRRQRHYHHNNRSLDKSLDQLKLLCSADRVDCDGPWTASALQLTGQSDIKLVQVERKGYGNYDWHTDGHIWNLHWLPSTQHLCWQLQWCRRLRDARGAR